MPQDNGLIAAFLHDGQACRSVGWDDIRRWSPEAGFLWVHLHQSHPDAKSWLAREAQLDPILVGALLEEETRPRTLRVGDSLLVILRGVNLNPGADPEDMVSVRLWLDAWRVITIRDERLLAIQDIRDRCEAGNGPTAPGVFLAAMTDRLMDRMAPVLEKLSERLDDLEEAILTAPSAEVRTGLGDLRRQAIALRRHIAPQRDATIRLLSETPSWLTENDRARLRETADTVTRYVEDLDAVRERAAVTQEELTTRLSDRMSRTMYVLSLVAAVFLPLSFLTGLLGINVGGIPGSNYQFAFVLVCLALAAIAGLELVFFHRKRWF